MVSKYHLYTTIYINLCLIGYTFSFTSLQPSTVPPFTISSSSLQDNALPSKYCQPANTSCWPSLADWLNFNATVNGNLLSIQPPGYPCFVSVSSPGCMDVYMNFINPLWRASKPGAMQSPQWEGDSEGNDCNNPSNPCFQGNVPLYGVQIYSINDIITTINFARQRNIRIIVKTTGHDWLGRSTAPDALLIWMHTYKGISINSAIPSVTINSGEMWENVYNTLSPTYTIVGGSAGSVGASGGYVLGGGHGFASPAYGLAVDNVLSFTVVLANGTATTISEFLFPDLFWGLRGGGSGLAIITSTTYKIYPSPPTVTGLYTVYYLMNGLSSLEKFLTLYLPIVSALDRTQGNGAGVVAGGTVSIMPNTSVLTSNLVFNGTITQAQSYMSQVENLVMSISSEIYVYTNEYKSYTTMNDWWYANDRNFTSGMKTYIGSRFLPYSLCNDAVALPTVITKLTNAIWKTPMALIRVLGGNVRTNDIAAGTSMNNYNAHLTKTAISPYFRDAFWHILIGTQYPLNSTNAVQNYTRDMVGGWMRELEDAIPNSGGYWGEAEYTDPNYEYNIWGSNSTIIIRDNCTNATNTTISLYGKLQQLKEIYDPTDYLGCYHCIQLPIVYYSNNTCNNNTDNNNTYASPSPSPSASASTSNTFTANSSATATASESPNVTASAISSITPTSTASLSPGATPSNTPSNVPVQPSVTPSATASYGTRSIRDATFVLWDVPINVYAIPLTLDILVNSIQLSLASMLRWNGANYSRFQQAVTVSLTKIQDIASNKIIFSSTGYSGNTSSTSGLNSTNSDIRILSTDLRGNNEAGSEGVTIQYTVLIKSSNASLFYSPTRNIALMYSRPTDYLNFIMTTLQSQASISGNTEIANGFSGVEATQTSNRNGGDSNGGSNNSGGTAAGVTIFIIVVLAYIYYRRRKARITKNLNDYNSRAQRVHRSVSAKLHAQAYPAYAYEMTNAPSPMPTAPVMTTAVMVDTSSDWRINSKKGMQNTTMNNTDFSTPARAIPVPIQPYSAYPTMATGTSV